MGAGASGARGSGVVSTYLSSSSSLALQAARPLQIRNGPLMEHGGSRRLVRGAKLGIDFEVCSD